MKYFFSPDSSRIQEQLRLGSGTPWLEPKKTTFIIRLFPNLLQLCSVFSVISRNLFWIIGGMSKSFLSLIMF